MRSRERRNPDPTLDVPMPYCATAQPSKRFRAICASLVAAGVAAAMVQQASPQGSQGNEPVRVTFRIIVVSTIQDADRIAARLAQGGEFAAIAQSLSIDPSAARGGLVGPVALSDLRPELRTALQQLSGSAVSSVIRVPTGFALLQLAPEPRLSRGPRLSAGEIPALAAVGSVQYTVSVDGFGEATTILDEFPKPDGWEQDPMLMCEMRQESLSVMTEAMRGFIAASEEPGTSVALFDLIQAHVVMGQIHAYAGTMSDTIAQFEAAHRHARTGLPEVVPQLIEMLGVAHLHKSGIDNGVPHRPGDRCLLSPHAHRPYDDPIDSQRAVAYFLEYLESRPDDLEVKWLLNIAYMTLGGYPSQVPMQHLIPPAAFESAEDVGRFTDVAVDAGLMSVASAGGVIVDDFTNDGRLEVLTSSFDSCGPMSLFRRGDDGLFRNVAEEAGLGGQLGGLNLIQADYNNDGCLDVLVLRGGWEAPQRKSLLKNNCDGTFTDVTAASGLAHPASSTQTAVWVDIDNDGFIDLFVGNEDRPAQLFRNRGDGTFEDIAQTAGVDRVAFTKAVAAADYDNDGYADLYVTNLGGGNFLYRNNRDGTFTDVAESAGVLGPERGFPSWFFDYDNDGWPDLFVSSYYLSVDETARAYLDLPRNAPTMRLYRNLGNGRFADVTAQVGLDKVFMPMGANFGDIDNDGFLDIYLGTGSPSYAALVPSVLLRNRNGTSFVDVTVSSGTGELHKGHGVAFADLDHDGDLEIVFEVGGATPGDAHALRLFENPGHGNDWLGLRLVGVTSNRGAIGARITVTVDTDGSHRAIHRTVNSGGSFGASPLQQHIGLGRDARTVTVEVWWPASDTRQRFASVPKNQVLEIHELAKEYQTLDRPPLPLGRR
jgi:hypothetical protein